MCKHECIQQLDCEKTVADADEADVSKNLENKEKSCEKQVDTSEKQVDASNNDDDTRSNDPSGSDEPCTPSVKVIESVDTSNNDDDTRSKDPSGSDEPCTPSAKVIESNDGDMSPPNLTSPGKRKLDEIAKQGNSSKRARTRRSASKSEPAKVNEPNEARKRSLRSSKQPYRIGDRVSRAASKIRVGARLKASGERWCLPSTAFFEGTITK